LSDPGRRDVLSRVVAASVVVLPLAMGVQGPAASQSALTEDELERISREIAIEAVKYGGLRWPPGQFPLRVAFSAGENLKQNTDCSEQWQRQFEEYVRFINAKSKLLTPTSINDALDAYVFYGVFAELEVLPAFKLEETQFQNIERIQSRNQDRFSRSFQFGYGADGFIEFGSNFKDLSANLVACYRNPAEALAGALLPSYFGIVSTQVYRRFGNRPDPTLAWRAHRRLLSAMSWLPDNPMDMAQYKRAIVRSLSDE
jgi:hypothetical protein